MRTAFSVVGRSLRAYMGDRASSYAAAIAYYTLFSVLPLSIFVIGFGSYFVTNSDRDRMVANIADALGGASTVKIYEQVQSFTEGRAELGIIGLIGALWGASAVFTAVRTGLNVVWNTSDGRPWLIAKAVDLLSVIGFGLLLALALAGVAGLVALSELTKEMLGSRVAGLTSFGLGVFFLVLPFLIAFATFSQLYVVTSPASVHWTDCWHGAAVAAAGFQATSYGFGWYVRSFGRFDKLYGSLGAVIAFVFYAYVVASLVLLGAEIARQYVEWKRRRPSCVPVL